MPEFCKHHLTEPAHWECNICNSSYCHDCILKRNGGYDGSEIHYFCPSCVRPANWVAPSNIIKPFWERLQTFFAYPFKNIFTIIFMIVIAIISAFFSDPGLLNMLATLGLFVLLMKYAFTAMGSTARGALIPPNVDLKSLSDNASQAFVPVVLTVIMVVASVFIIETAGVFIGFTCLILGFLSLPSMIMSYVAGGSILHALNPVLFIKIMFRIGWPYLMMVFFLFLFLLAPNALVFTIGKYLPTMGKHFLYSLANSYYTIIFFHLMGYVLLQFHQQIGYSVDQEEFIASFESENSGEPVEMDEATMMLSKIEFLAKEGKYDEALSYIKRESSEKITNPLLSKQYFKLLKIKNDPDIVKHSMPHLKLMISENDKSESCEVFQTCLANKTSVNLAAPSLIKLGNWLNESGKPKESISAYNKIISEQPDNHLVPMAYFRAACILNEKLDNKAKAGKIMKLLKIKYPMDDIIPLVNNYIKQIEASA